MIIILVLIIIMQRLERYIPPNLDKTCLWVEMRDGNPDCCM